MLPIATIFIISITSIIAAFISGATGLGGGTILLAILAISIEPELIVPLHAMLQLVSGGTRVIVFWRNINWQIVRYFLVGILPGVLLGIYTFTFMDKSTIRLIIALFILISIYAPKIKVKQQLAIKVFIPVGFIAGIIGIFFGAIGPFIAPFFLRSDINKEELIATKAFVQIISYVLKIPLFGFIGIGVLHLWPLILFLSVFLIGGTLLGKQFLGKLSKQQFQIIFKVILTLVAVRMLVNSLL